MIAPAKLNLCLYLGPRRADGLHELCSLFQPLQLADRIEAGVAEGPADEIVCEAVQGPNLAAEALAALRAAGWEAPPQRLLIEKRIPIAAGLGGGSADAAAILRMGIGEVEGLPGIAAALGADVPSQMQPRFCLVTGAGERLEPLLPSGEWAAVLVPDERGLSTAEVYAEADRLGLGRPAEELASLRERLLAAARPGVSPLAYAQLLDNDLGRAAISLRPELERTLRALREAGAEHALISGSGPTAVGLYADVAEADAGASALAASYAGAIVTAPLQPAGPS